MRETCSFGKRGNDAFSQTVRGPEAKARMCPIICPGTNTYFFPVWKEAEPPEHKHSRCYQNDSPEGGPVLQSSAHSSLLIPKSHWNALKRRTKNWNPLGYSRLTSACAPMRAGEGEGEQFLLAKAERISCLYLYDLLMHLSETVQVLFLISSRDLFIARHKTSNAPACDRS